MERQVGHLARLVDDLLDVSRITQGKIELRKERLDLADGRRPAPSRACGLSWTSGGTAWRSRCRPRPSALEADPARLEQVLANLLTNAAKYTPPGGHIRLTAGREGDEAVVRVRGQRHRHPARRCCRTSSTCSSRRTACPAASRRAWASA